jgi:hypothetical protein
MTESRRQKIVGRASPHEISRRAGTLALQPSSVFLLGLCLCILALRVTYTESPTAQMLIVPGSLGDTVYSLTLSGLLIFAFLSWLLWHILRSSLVYRVTGIEIGLAVFGTAAVISACGASDKRAAITQVMSLLGPIFAALLLAQVLDRPGKMRLVLIVVVALGIVSAYESAEQFFLSNAITIEEYEKSPDLLLEPLGIETGTFQHFLFEHRLYSRGVRGFFTTSNSAASFAILACAAAAALLVRKLQACKAREAEPRYGLFTLLAGIVIVAGLFVTQSKGGILAFFVGLALCGLLVSIDRWFGSRKRRVLAALVLLVLLLAAGAGSAAVLYGLKHGSLPGGNSMLVRWQYWVASMQMYADHRLTGVGPGNFSDYYTHYKPAAALESVADPHNFVLSLITQYGPLGLIGFLAMVFVPLWQSVVAPAATLPTPDAHAQPSFRTLALIMLAAVCACVLVIRLLLIPTTADSPDVLLYEIVTVHVAPVAAFVVGFLLVGAPLNDGHGGQADFTGATLPAVLGSAVLAVLLHNLVDFALFEPGVWMAFWITIACLIAMRVQPQAGFCIIARRGRVLKPLASAAAIVLLASYVLYVWKPVCDATLGIQQAQLAASAGNFDGAHQHLAAAMRADPLSPVAANFSGRLYLQQCEQAKERQPPLLEEAARCFSEAIERNPADYKNYEKLAMVCSRLGQQPKAYDWYLKAAGLYPGCERIWFELAQTADELGRAGLALCHYTKAVEIEDRYRQQFRRMYPDRDKIVSRLGDKEYEYAKRRIAELSK